MDPLVNPGRRCPKCESRDYVFRGRKKIAADPEKNQEEAVETKFRCRACGNEWKERAVKG